MTARCEAFRGPTITHSQGCERKKLSCLSRDLKRFLANHGVIASRSISYNLLARKGDEGLAVEEGHRRNLMLLYCTKASGRSSLCLQRHAGPRRLLATCPGPVCHAQILPRLLAAQSARGGDSASSASPALETDLLWAWRKQQVGKKASLHAVLQASLPGNARAAVLCCPQLFPTVPAVALKPNRPPALRPAASRRRRRPPAAARVSYSRRGIRANPCRCLKRTRFRLSATASSVRIMDRC